MEEKTKVMISQNKAILKRLQSGESITPIDALVSFGCFRLSARIYDLRMQGHEIEMKMVVIPDTNKRVASYSLVKK